MKKKILISFSALLGLYFLLCIGVYIFQEKLIFLPEKLPAGYTFQFEQDFEEFNIETPDGKLINALLFKADSSKGLIFYLHGNAGSLRSWGEIADTYTELGHDIFILDYRGYGKSEGSISSQEQVFKDNQLAYNFMKSKFSEDEIIVLGYSIGSGMAAKLAADNQPQQLILQAPYYNMKEILHTHYPIFPGFLLRYHFETNEYLKYVNAPITILHGEEDKIIPIKSSIKLKHDFEGKVELFTIEGLGHNGFIYNFSYNELLKEILK